jgi:hypothetical protein
MTMFTATLHRFECGREEHCESSVKARSTSTPRNLALPGAAKHQLSGGGHALTIVVGAGEVQGGGSPGTLLHDPVILVLCDNTNTSARPSETTGRTSITRRIQMGLGLPEPMLLRSARCVACCSELLAPFGTGRLGWRVQQWRGQCRCAPRRLSECGDFGSSIRGSAAGLVQGDGHSP